MRSRPTEPTAALAALISGNHRFLAARARVSAMDEAAVPFEASGTSAPHADCSFAVFVSLSIGDEDLARIFDLAPSRPTVLTVGEQSGALDESNAGLLDRVVAMPSMVLVVVIAQLLLADVCGVAFADAERRSMETLQMVMESSPSIRKRLRGRQLRAVAAVLDAGSGRVHWLGEHAEQTRLVSR
jgi:hypothetical protein